jgi:hypothetical protein
MSTTVASTAAGARRTWTSLRALLFLETRRPLQIGRKPLRPGHRQRLFAGVQGCRILTTDSMETAATTTATAHGFELEDEESPADDSG